MADLTVSDQMPSAEPLQPHEASQAFTTLARAFATDPPSRWMFPDEHQYGRYFPTFAKAFGGAAIARGTALAVRDGGGVALWLPPGCGPDEEGLGRLIEDGVEARRRGEVSAVFEEMGRVHPVEPHWYLPLIGVDPALQGKGLGAALLRPVLARCDGARLPAYLESTNPRNRPLYERMGFVAVGEIRVGTCPPIVPMLRPPSIG